MAGGGGHLTITSIPENCTAQTYNSSSRTWNNSSLPITAGGASSYTFVRILDSNGENITKNCEPTCGVGVVSETIVIKTIDYSGMGNIEGGYYFSLRGGNVDKEIGIVLDDSSSSSNSIGNIPMGELTFNGVQSVTYNGTDYTKLVVDGTSYPPSVTIISFTINGTSYQAEEGMTWAEWVDSEYNTPGCYVGTYDWDIGYSIIWFNSKRYIGKETDFANPVKASDVIENGVKYATDNSPIAPK